MGWEDDFTLPEMVNWQHVFNLAQEQGVYAIAIDGFEVLKSHHPELLSSAKDKRILLEAIGGVQMVEYNYLHHYSTLLKLSELLQQKSISFLIMKGFSCGKFYPIPKHRECGDIDIYPGHRFEESDEILKESNLEEGRYYYRHSVYVLDGVMVENHRVLSDLRGPRRQTFDFESLLQKEALKSIEEGSEVIIDGDALIGAKYPSAFFNALFLPWHVSAHFMFERVTIRHLLDWALFLVNEGKEIDVAMFREAKHKYTYGYSKIADILTFLSIRYLKMPVSSIPSEIVNDAINFDEQLANKVFNYMFNGQSRTIFKNVWRFRWNNIKLIWNNRWKYKEIYNMSLVSFLYYKTIGVIFKVGE